MSDVLMDMQREISSLKRQLRDFTSGQYGVTNGDAHDHAGGDGAQINHTGLANIGTNTHAQIDTFISNIGGARVTHSVAQTLTTSGTLYALTFDSERFDDGNYHDNATNNTRLTVAAAGWYLIGGECAFAVNATGSRDIGIRLNGVNFIGFQRTNANATAGIATDLQVMSFYYLAASDYVELWVRQYSGGSLDTVKSAAHSPEFWIMRMK